MYHKDKMRSLVQYGLHSSKQWKELCLVYKMQNSNIIIDIISKYFYIKYKVYINLEWKKLYNINHTYILHLKESFIEQ